MLFYLWRTKYICLCLSVMQVKEDMVVAEIETCKGVCVLVSESEREKEREREREREREKR